MVGPVDTILLTIETSSGDPNVVSREQRFWIDPSRSYLTVRSERRFSGAKNAGSTQLIVVVEKADKSPQGIWYPTLVQHILITEKNGKTTEVRHTTRPFLDFDTEFPDSLFKPVDRPTAE